MVNINLLASSILLQQMMDAFMACSSAWFVVDIGKIRFHHL
jgi:hypothetical protein